MKLLMKNSSIHKDPANQRLTPPLAPVGFFLVVVFFVGASLARADPLTAHAPFGHYTVVTDGSIFKDSISFGSAQDAIMAAFNFQPPVNPAVNNRYGGVSGTFHATFTADPNYLFSGSGALGLGSYTWYNDAGGGFQEYTYDWAVSNSSYSGPTHIDFSSGRTIKTLDIYPGLGGGYERESNSS